LASSLTRLTLSVLAIPLSAASLFTQQAAPPPKFDSYVAQVLQAFRVPGVAVAIVKDGKVVLAKGYGVRKLGEPTPVDARTRFGIASNTKVFTATAIAMLVEEGKLEWDAPVTSFRSAYAYDNVLYFVAGEVIEAVSGTTWEDFVRYRILSKVGMTNSDVMHSGAGAGGEVTAPHAEVNDTVRPVAPFLSDNTNPAGGIMSGARTWQNG
jgi:CubicO group peptidase (beta-lactamase class C family)